MTMDTQAIEPPHNLIGRQWGAEDGNALFLGPLEGFRIGLSAIGQDDTRQVP